MLGSRDAARQSLCQLHRYTSLQQCLKSTAAPLGFQDLWLPVPEFGWTLPFPARARRPRSSAREGGSQKQTPYGSLPVITHRTYTLKDTVEASAPLRAPPRIVAVGHQAGADEACRVLLEQVLAIEKHSFAKADSWSSACATLPD